MPFPLPTSKTAPFLQFCEYWNNLIKDPVSKYARLYIRRWFPVLLPEETEQPSGLKKEAFPCEKTLYPHDGPLSELKLLSEVGVGDYTIRLNDTRRPFEQATILHCEKFCTMRDWDHYPPLFKVERLDWEDEANKVYIKYAQSHGIFRRDDERKQDEEEMANAAVVTQLLEQNKQLTEQVTRKETPAPAAPMPAKNDGDGGALKAVADLAIAALNRQPVAAPIVAGADPMKMVEGIAGVVQTLMPKPDTSSSDLAKEVVKESAAANERVFKMQETALNELRQQVKDARTPPPAVATPPVPPTLAQQFQEMETLMGAAKRIAKGGAVAEEDERPGKYDKWLEAAPLVAPVISQIVSGVFQAITFGLQTWQQVSFNAALKPNGVQPQPPTTMQQAPEPGKPIPPSAPQPTPEQIQQQQQMNIILAGVQRLIKPMSRALDNSKTGDEFAEQLIEYADEGRSDYDRIRNVAQTLQRIGMQVQGETEIDKFKNSAAFLFQQFPPFWQKVSTMPTFGTFLEEFFNYDEIASQKEDQK